MEIRNAVRSARLRQPNPIPAIFCLLFFSCFLSAGCGVPGEPTPPSPPTPAAVSDLAAHQVGDGVLLTFTPPNKSTLGHRLTETPTLEVMRGSLRPDGTLDTNSFRAVDTVPGSLLGGYVQQGKVQFLDPISPEETRAHPGEAVIYRVRTRISERKPSGVSNDVTLNLYPVPQRIDALEAQVTENNIRLQWAAPAHTSAGVPLPGVEEYHVYRGELDPASSTAAGKDLRAAVWKVPLLQITATTAPEYQDAGFDFGKTYAYVVRSAIQANGPLLESADSRPAIVTPKDIFPPAAPQDVVAALLPGATAGSQVVDLSWSINVETDLAGYRVYRSEREDARGQLMTAELLPTPAYRDNSAQGARRYWYTVSAVDRAGNESAPSASVLVEVP
jgi:hypothetical protein